MTGAEQLRSVSGTYAPRPDGVFAATINQGLLSPRPRNGRMIIDIRFFDLVERERRILKRQPISLPVGISEFISI